MMGATSGANLWARLALRWSHLTFQTHYGRITPKIRALRLLEEVLELAQAENVLGSEAQTVLNQVYSRPEGKPYDELGGVCTCLAAYAGTRGFDLDEAFWREFERIMDPRMMEKVRNRNLSGDKIGLRAENTTGATGHHD